MKQNLLLATMALLTACGPSGTTPWDQNHDGLVTPCEGLNTQACDATTGCERTPVLCTMECRSDGHGGCLPCAGADLCRPVPPPLVLACAQLPASLCAVTARCELVQQTVCGVSTEPTDPSVPRCGTGSCTTTQACADRAPATCESLSTAVCLTHPGCALDTFEAACANACDPDGVCPPCAPPQQRCVTVQPPDLCELRDPTSCTMDGRCVLEQGPLCLCSPDGVCPPSATPSLRCVPAPPPDLCGARYQSSCTIDGQCVLEQGPVCDAVCDPDGSCPPCANPSQRCVPAPAPDLCGSRDPNSCAVDGLCVLENGPACLPACDPNGFCPPCANPSQRCVPAPAPDLCGSRDPNSCGADGLCVLESGTSCYCDPNGFCPQCANPAPRCVPMCAGRDLNSCEVDGRCAVRAWACPAVCQDDGHGGCVPCNTPPVACVPVVSSCSGLDRASCAAAGCTPLELDCTQVCRDDGHGGCLPCPDFVCTDGSSIGGATPPPSP